ncbi:MAG TPA: preprotein translocase subunit SecG [bacterium]|jgi:protein translocase SecG subunit|nr:preprotein translocase subunit SecG [bacterium]HQG58640.1 preprotein translocase subunit SecG [bacterium]HQG79033.1 preprotein translocase subunit SecG [bacterium]HQK41548.1 preprotein translocase subunit SecG [bacterium]
MLNFAKTLQIIICLLLTILVLIQSKSSGLSSSLKNSFNMYRSLRGVEKVIFIMTIVLGSLLVINSLLIVFLS